MDAKITLSFDKNVIEKAKSYAEKHNMSLSRLTEFLYLQITNDSYKSLDEFPISDWISAVSEGEAQYLSKPRGRKSMKKDFFDSKK